jgi:hypothetical protein
MGYGWTAGVRFSAGLRGFIFSIASRPVLGPTQPPVSAEVKRPVREADQSFLQVPRSRMVELYFHFPVCHPGIVINQLPACQSALQPWVNLGLLYNQSPPGVRFVNKIVFYRMGFLALCPTPILEDEGVSLSLDSTL